MASSLDSRAAGAVLAFVATIGACACTSLPKTSDRTAVGAALTDRSGAPAGALPFSPTWTAPPGVSLTDGLTIDEAVAAALWNNADFQAALSSLGVARADLVQAGMLRNPMLSLLFPWGPKQFEATLSVPIDAIWQRPKRIEDARVNAEVVAQQLVTHGLTLIADVKLAYLDAIAAERGLALAEEQAGIARKTDALAASRARAGEISDFDARLAHNDAARLDAARLSRAGARDLAQARLRALMGLAPDRSAMQLADPPRTESACGDLAGLLETAWASRPDVRAAELAIEAAGARAGLAKASIVNLTGVLDMNGQGREGFEMGPGLGVELPIFSQQNGARARAAADLEQASRRYVATRANVAAGVDAALIALVQAREAVRVLDAELGASLATESRQAQSLFDAGEISLLDLLNTRQRLLATETARLDATFGALRATVRLEAAVGRTCAR